MKTTRTTRVYENALERPTECRAITSGKSNGTRR